VVFLDRQQGGRQRLAALEGGLAVTVHAVVSTPLVSRVACRVSLDGC
jgi:hypothetical protein